MEEIDVLNEELEFFMSFTEEINHSLYENFGIESLKEWKKGQKNFTTVYKLIQLDLSMGEYQNEVNKSRKLSVSLFFDILDRKLPFV